MIIHLGNKIARNLVKSNIITLEEAELYSYGFFLLLSKILFFVITSVLGAIIGVLWHSILFYLLFSILREYAGGIHAKTELGCMLSTTLILLLSVNSIQCLIQFRNPLIALVLLLFGYIIILLLSPLDTPEKPLVDSDRKYFQHISRNIATFYTSLGILAAIIGSSLLYILAVTEALVGILLLGKICCFPQKAT